MDYCVLAAFQSFKCLFDDVFTGLCEHLYGNIIGDEILFDECAAEVVFGIRSGREVDLYLLEADRA